MRRGMIAGGPGSGKSTMAIELGRRTGRPVHQMDHIHWLPGWVERDRDEKDRLTRSVHARERWILEGGHSRTYAERVARADTFVWLDVPVAPPLARPAPTRRPPRPDQARPARRLHGVPWRRDGGLRAVHPAVAPKPRTKLHAINYDPPPHLATWRLD